MALWEGPEVLEGKGMDPAKLAFLGAGLLGGGGKTTVTQQTSQSTSLSTVVQVNPSIGGGSTTGSPSASGAAYTGSQSATQSVPTTVPGSPYSYLPGVGQGSSYNIPPVNAQLGYGAGGVQFASGNMLPLVIAGAGVILLIFLSKKAKG